MSNYKRIYLSNHSYFFTVVTDRRCKIFAVDENVQLLKSTMRYVQARKPFKIDAICILPDHIYCIWTMPDDCNHSLRWQMIKTQFTRQFKHHNPTYKQKSIWQPRYWEHMIRDDSDLHRHIDYIHYNPVKHGLVESVKDWRYSSYNKFKQQSYYADGWGIAEPLTILDMDYE